jgi:PAS domain S-box-containing protein
MWVYDLETLAFLEVNGAAVEKYGYSREEFLTMTLKDIRPPEDVPRLLQTVATLKEPLQHSAHWRHTLKNGSIIEVEISLHRLQYNERNAALVIVQDITERNRAEEALRDREHKYRNIFENMQDVYYEASIDGTILEISPSIEIMSKGQYHRNDLVGKSMYDLYSGVGERPALLSTLKERGSVTDFEVTLKNRDGSSIPCSISSKIQFNAQGKPTTIIGSMRDITERKRAEEVIRDSEERFRLVFDHVLDGISIYSEDPDPAKRTLIECNERYAAMAGRSREELLQLGSTLGLQRTLEETANDNRLESLTGGVAYRGSFTWIRSDGRENFIEYVAMPATWRGKSYSIGIDRDVTERKKAEESQLLLNTALESTANGVVITDVKGDIVWVNKAFTGITGYTLKEVLGHNPKILKSGRQNDSFYSNLWKTISAGNVWHGELINRKKDGSLYADDTTITPLKKANGEITHFIAIEKDITEQKKLDQALSHSEERFHQLFDDAPVGYHELDIQGRIVEVNRTEQEMLGYRAEEMLGHKAWEFIVEGETSRKAIDAQIAGTIASDRTVERTFQRKDGTTVNVLLRNRTLFNDAKEVVGIRSALQDITERKRADRELTLMAQTVASVRDCISITDLEERFLFVNEAFQQMYGYAAAELLGKNISVVRSPLTSESISARILPETKEGGWHGEILNRRKDGTDLPVELWTSIVKDGTGTPVALVGVARDISERKNSEAHLKKSEQQFRLIAENVADMIAVLDLNGRRIYNSPAYRSLFGDPDSLRGTDGFREIHPDDVARIKQVFEQTVETGIGQRLEYQFLLKDGSVRNIESKGSVIRDDDGKISQVVVVSRDVTEEKRLAAQFLRSQRMESIGTLAGGIAHDLNNVLAPIMMAIEVLRTKISDPGGQKILNTIETSATRGADIVRQVLAFGRGVKSDRILVQLKHLMHEVAKIAGETFPKAIEITTNIPRNLWTVSADPTQMHQVLLNLLVNARDAMPQGGTLTIAAENITLDENHSRMHPDAKAGAYVSMAITDTGTGVPAGIREKIFEPFFTTKDVGMGTGLGLSTTLAIVKGHEGFITLDSELGKGTTFKIYIPATGTDSAGAAASEVVDLPMGHDELILIIDDEEAIREITKETLEAYGYKAITASDGAEGISVFAENKKMIRAVIIDIMMPVMDGTAAIHVLKTIDPDVKIIAASGLTTKGSITTPLDSNVKAVLVKPYTAENLLKTLDTVL